MGPDKIKSALSLKLGVVYAGVGHGQEWSSKVPWGCLSLGNWCLRCSQRKTYPEGALALPGDV